MDKPRSRNSLTLELLNWLGIKQSVRKRGKATWKEAVMSDTGSGDRNHLLVSGTLEKQDDG